MQNTAEPAPPGPTGLCRRLRADFPGGSAVKSLPAMQEKWVCFLGQEDALEKEIATPCHIPAWKNPTDRGAWWAAVHGVAKSWT